MIRKFLSRVFSRRKKHSVIPFESHGVARESISRCARSVTDGLQAQGHAAFVVGGAVRDLLLGREPKDFDVATTPARSTLVSTPAPPGASMEVARMVAEEISREMAG